MSKENRYFPDRIKIGEREYQRFTEGGNGYYYVRPNSFDPWYFIDEVGELYTLYNGEHHKSDKKYEGIWETNEYTEMEREYDMITGGVFG